jgi:hypothetical protein
MTYNHHNCSELIESTITVFQSYEDHTSRMSKVQWITKVRLRTLYAWGERIRVDPEWQPPAEHFSENALVFPDEIEEHMANFILANSMDPGRSLTRTTLQPLILMLVQGLVSDGIFDQEVLNFQCSYHFLESFLQRIGLSFRRARPERRLAIDGDECAELMTDLLLALQLYPPDHILNLMNPTGFSLWPAIKPFQEEPRKNISRWTGAFLGGSSRREGQNDRYVSWNIMERTARRLLPPSSHAIVCRIL